MEGDTSLALAALRVTPEPWDKQENLDNNEPSHNGCIDNDQGRVQATCWQVVQDWKPLITDQ